MKKRLLSITLCLCMAVGLLPLLAVRAQAADTKTMAQLKESFPAGRYWNHYVNNYGEDGDMMGTREDFADSVTDSPCSIHGATAGRVGIYDCNCFDGALQCMGFARRLAYGYYGTRVSEWSSDDHLDALKAGDVVQYNFSATSYGHTVWVTSVNGDRITYADCNGQSLGSPANNCKIRWDVPASRSLFYSGTGNYKVYHAPYAAADSAPAGPKTPAWPTDDIEDFYATIYYVKGGNFVEAQGGDGTTYTNVQLSKDSVSINTTDPKRVWFFDKQDDGSYRIVNEWCGWCLDVAGGIAGDEINVATWHVDHGDLPERWYIKQAPDSDDKWYSLVTALAYPSYVMTVCDEGTAEGTNVQLSTTDWKTGNEAQQFNILRLEDHQYQPAKPPMPENVWVRTENGRPTITWSAVPTQSSYIAGVYEVRIKNAETGSVLFSTTQTTTSYTHHSSLPAGEWLAEVRAIDTRYADSSSYYGSDYCSRRFFVDPPCTITLTSAGIGAVTGGGSYRQGDTAVVSAAAGNGYHFVKWTENGSFVSSNARLTLKVERDWVLTAVFEKDAPRDPYPDVPWYEWYYDAVSFVSENGYMSGSEGLFRPEDSMTRAMLAQVLYNRAGRPNSTIGSGFSDVPSNEWYAQAVAWAASRGIANGYENGRFGPDDSVTREQLVTMLWRYAGAPASSRPIFAGDAYQISGFAQTAMRWAVENGIIKGHENGQLDPQGMATRAQAAQMLKNFWGM